MSKTGEDTTFDSYIKFLLGEEGDFSNHPSDRGGITYYGLSDSFLKSIGWTGTPPNRKQAVELYRTHFWRGRRCHEVDPLVGWAMCDAFVQHPPKAAAMMIQQGLGVEPDGVVGPLTIEAGKTPDVRLFWRRYIMARIRFYNGIRDNDDTQHVFMDGWHARLHRLTEGAFDAGMFGAGPERKGSAIKSPAAKAGAAGVGMAGLIVFLFEIVGVTVSGVQEGLLEVGLPAAFVGVITTWLTKMNVKQG